MRIALFVEGSVAPPPPRGLPALEEIWKKHLRQALSLHELDPIVPISKRHLVAMDPGLPRMSGAGEALDQLMYRKLKSRDFDAAIVAWDLVPRWNPQGEFCRWDETLNLYRFLKDSRCLPELWTGQAERRYREMSSRKKPSLRPGVPALERGMVLPLCMEPMFEALLTQDEAAARRALGLARRVKGWPSKGWGDASVRHPDAEVLGPAIRAATRVRPKLQVTRRVPGDMRTNKDGWGEFLLRKLLDDQQARSRVVTHPICVRLKELALEARVSGS